MNTTPVSVLPTSKPLARVNHNGENICTCKYKRIWVYIFMNALIHGKKKTLTKCFVNDNSSAGVFQSKYHSFHLFGFIKTSKWKKFHTDFVNNILFRVLSLLELIAPSCK